MPRWWSASRAAASPRGPPRCSSTTAHAVGRTDIILSGKIGQSSFELLKQRFVSHGDRDARGASLPNSHEPDSVEAISGEGIPLLLGNSGEIHWFLVFLAEFAEPDPGVDLIDDGVFRPRCHDRLRRTS